MTEDKNKINEDTKIPPINSAAEHYQKIMGMPSQKADLRTMPRWIRIFAYCIAGIVIVGIFIIISITIYQKVWIK